MNRLHTLVAFVIAGWTLGAYAAESLPYYNPGEDLSTVITQGQGSKTWQTYTMSGITSFRIAPPGSATLCDAWLWTPELDIQPGKGYKVEVNSRVQLKRGTTAFEIYACDAASTSAGSQLLASFDELPTTWSTYTAYFEGGTNRYVGFKDICKGNHSFFYIDEIRVSEVDINMPSAPGNLTASPTGKEVSVTLNAPPKSVFDKALPQISKVSLYRNGLLVKEWDSPAAGASLSFTDRVSQVGPYEYVATATVDGTEGDPAKASVTVGGSSLKPDTWGAWDDINGNNTKGMTTYVPGEGVKVTWPAYNGGEGVSVTYTVTRLSDDKVVGQDLTECELVDADALNGDCALYTYKVTAKTADTEAKVCTTATLSAHNSLPFIANISEQAMYEYTAIVNPWYNTSNELVGNGNRWQYFKQTIPNNHGNVPGFFAVAEGDQWLITPGVEMKKGKTYRIDMDILSQNLIPKRVSFELFHGNTNTAEGMTDRLTERTFLDHITPRTYSAFYTPAEDEHGFIGFHTVHPKQEWSSDNIAISAWEIKEVPSSLPLAPTDLEVKFSTADPTKATISFKAPTKDVTGNDLTALERIEMLKDGVLFHTFTAPAPGADLSKEIDVVVGQMAVYTLVPFTAGGEGLSATTDVVITEPPYQNTFDTEDDLTGYTVIDIDQTGYTWAFQNDAVRAYPSRENGLDDYLVTPPMHLEAGQFYKLSFLTWSNATQGNRIEVLMGTSPTVDGLKTTVVSPYEVPGKNRRDAALVKEYFTVQTTGEYYLAWRAMAEAGAADQTFVDDITVSEKIDPTVPNMVTNLQITPDPEGELSVNIEFDLPIIDLAGNPLTSKIYMYEVYRDGTRFFQSSPGNNTHITVTDTKATEGVHLYSIVCLKARNVPGREKEEVAYVGLNRPGPVAFLNVSEAADNWGNITLDWGTPTQDINGFKLNTSAITYTVGRLNTNILTGDVSETVYATGLTDLKYTVQALQPTDKQEYCRFFVRPATVRGEAAKTMITPYTAIGKPYSMPVTESFPQYRPETSLMAERTGNGSPATWGFNSKNPVTGVHAVDGDDGLAMMEAMFQGGGSRLMTARIDLAEAVAPMLYMWVYNQGDASYEDSNTLAVESRDMGGEGFTPLASHTVAEWAGNRPGWQKVAVDLASLKGKIVYLGFNATCKNFVFTHLDRITVEEARGHDLSMASVDVTRPYVGIPHTVTGLVKNHGTQPANFTLVCSLDGTELERRENVAVGAGESVSVEFVNTLGRDALGKHKYTLEALYDDDVETLDNKLTSAEFTLDDNTFPTVENLAAEQQGAEVALSWEAPLIPDSPSYVTDDFMSYPAWTTMHTGGLGDWTLVDGDVCGVGGFQNFEMPNVAYGSRQSFFIMDMSFEPFKNDERYRSHSGSQCLVSAYCSDQFSFTDDILISPRLGGKEFTLSFWAKGLADEFPESFQVYYSTTGKELADFTNLVCEETVGGTWTNYTFDLPDGATYFEIRHYSKGGYFFFLDDITYQPRGEESLVLDGYNVYMKGAKVNDTPLAEAAWRDTTPAEGTNTYAVTAVYDRGESPEQEVSAGWSGINAVTSNGVAVTAESGSIRISGAQGERVAISNVAGLTLTVFSGSGDDTVPVAPGVYLVSVGQHVSKVMVP